MRQVPKVEAAIRNLEGFDVQFIDPDGGDPGDYRVADYPYERAARGNWSVARWRDQRFAKTYPDWDVQILDPDGEPVHGRTLLDNLRRAYLDAEWDDTADHEPEDDEERDEVAERPADDAGEVAERRSIATSGFTQQDLESRLWAAANSLRGPVDPSDFKAYIFPLLFYKRINDTWDTEHAEAVAKWGDDLDAEIEADYHRFTIPDGCHWADLRRAHENVGVALQKILDRIQQANPDTLAGIFGDVAWGNKDKLPEHALLDLIDAFGSLDLSPDKVGHDVLGAAYEYLLKQFADESGKKAGEFFTPRAVVRLLTRILDPQPTDSIYDPACGSGGMLVEAANEVIDSGGSLRQMRIYGQEVNLTTAAIARMNLYIHDIEDAKVLRGDTLRQPKFLDEKGRLEKFDIVIANPPFSLKSWGGENWAADPWGRAFCGVPPSGKADFAWVQHMVAHMHPKGGRVGVVMPHGVLFRSGAEAKIRQCLIEKDQLEAVIGLPANLFYSTSIPACLLIFRAAKPEERKGAVLIIDGAARFTKGRNQNQMDDTDIDAITQAYTAGEDPDGDGGVQVRLVPHAEIAENGWDLNIGRYLKTAAADTLDVATALEQLAEAQAALRDAEERLAERLKAAGYA